MPILHESRSQRALRDRFNRALMDDIPLLPMVFIIMSAFTTFVFYRRDRLYSRSFLGFCGVVCVLLSLVTGYGLMFLCGVTLTSMTQVCIPLLNLELSRLSCSCTRLLTCCAFFPDFTIHCVWHWT